MNAQNIPEFNSEEEEMAWYEERVASMQTAREEQMAQLVETRNALINNAAEGQLTAEHLAFLYSVEYLDSSSEEENDDQHDADEEEGQGTDPSQEDAVESPQFAQTSEGNSEVREANEQEEQEQLHSGNVVEQAVVIPISSAQKAERQRRRHSKPKYPLPRRRNRRTRMKRRIQKRVRL